MGALKGANEVEVAEERTVVMGREDPLPIRPLPAPLKPIHLLGPGMALTALAVGLGETFLWPRLGASFRSPRAGHLRRGRRSA